MIDPEQARKAYEEAYEDGKGEHCDLCGCDLHWGKCPEGHMQQVEFEKLLPEGWAVETYDIETPCQDGAPVISVRKGANRLQLTPSTCEGEQILQADWLACDSRLLNLKNVDPETLEHTYLDTLLGEYTWPEFLAGDAQRWFVAVVKTFDENGGF